jgi:diguanylate cyclase (GGDEF)-like protein
VLRKLGRREGDTRTRPTAGSSPRLRSRTRYVWGYNAVLATGAGALFVTVVRHLPQHWSTLHVPLLLLAFAFCASESWRVYFHFRRSAQSFALSEIPLVVGLFFATPDELVAARVLGAAVGLGLIRRHPPIKLTFNLALFALEAELLTVLIALTHATDAMDPITWLRVLGVTAVVICLGFLLSVGIISLAEGRLKWQQYVHNGVLAVIGGLASVSLGLEIVASLARNPHEIWLVILPIGAVSAALSLYTREYQKRQQMQHLYESSDLLQRTTAEQSAIPELLAQLCEVFRAETAGISLLPNATGGEAAISTMLSRGSYAQMQEEMSVSLLESFLPLLDERRRGLLAAKNHAGAELREWLRARGVTDAVATLLRGDEALLGYIFVGNQLGDVGSFGPDDLTLLETFAAQTSVAVQNARLDLRLKHQAFHDPLTNLANRALFTDRLEHALTRRERYADAIAVIFLDLDDFKMINDTLGHAAGDEVLRSVADRLRTVLRPSDTAARFGGDEFAILLEEGAAPIDVISVAERIVDTLRPHFLVAGRDVAVHASVGVASAVARDVGAEELLRRADVAMYRAKLRGKGTFEVFEPAMQEVVSRRLEIRTDLERALERRELVLQYQPILEMGTRTLTGVEALVRWNHPRWGLVHPGDFIPIAEETGLIADIGLYVLEEACRQCQEWQVAYGDDTPFSVAVNMSPRQLRGRNVVADVWSALTRTGLHPSKLVLEITEGVMLDAPEEASERLHALKALGVRLSIDDFGTGYSALSVLQDLPLDVLKIDKAFVDHVAEDPRRAAFTQAIIRLGKTLGLTLVAEGVETAEQAERLRSLGCELAQGYYFSRPVDAERISGLLEMSTASRALSRPSAPYGPDKSVLVLPTDTAGGELARRHAAERG